MKTGVFADPHYCSADVLCGTRRPALSFGKIKSAMDAFTAAGVEAVVCLGDLIDREVSHEDEKARLSEILSLIRSYKIPFHSVFGNHDYAAFTGEELLQNGLRIPPYTVDFPQTRWIVLDANYRSDGHRYDAACVDWTDSNLPEWQLDFLNSQLESSKKPCVVMVHQNLDPNVQHQHIIKNADKARALIASCNKVRLVIQGHYHPGADNIVDGIRYLTLRAMCEGEQAPYMILDL